jgi:hypothetical protein
MATKQQMQAKKASRSRSPGTRNGAAASTAASLPDAATIDEPTDRQLMQQLLFNMTGLTTNMANLTTKVDSTHEAISPIANRLLAIEATTSTLTATTSALSATLTTTTAAIETRLAALETKPEMAQKSGAYDHDYDYHYDYDYHHNYNPHSEYNGYNYYYNDYQHHHQYRRQHQHQHQHQHRHQHRSQHPYQHQLHHQRHQRCSQHQFTNKARTWPAGARPPTMVPAGASPSDYQQFTKQPTPQPTPIPTPSPTPQPTLKPTPSSSNSACRTTSARTVEVSGWVWGGGGGPPEVKWDNRRTPCKGGSPVGSPLYWSTAPGVTFGHGWSIPTGAAPPHPAIFPSMAGFVAE